MIVSVVFDVVTGSQDSPVAPVTDKQLTAAQVVARTSGRRRGDGRGPETVVDRQGRRDTNNDTVIY